MTTFDTILNQSLQDEINRQNNRPIDISESKNVDNLFKKLQSIDSDCNICYSNSKCLQCYQCNYKYCQDCMSKVISEFHKCSQCSANLINNYNKIEDKNKQIINELNKKKNQNQNQNQNENYNQKQNQNYNQNQQNNVFYPDYIDEMEQINIAIHNSLIELTNTKTTTNIKANNNVANNNVANNNVANNNTNKSKLEIYIEELQNNEILPYKFTSLKHHQLKPNFECVNDYNNKLLIFCADDKHLPNIEINYKIFNTTFQLEFNVLLVHLVKEKKFEKKFNNIWIKIHNTIQEFYKTRQNIHTNKHTNRLVDINHNKNNELLERIKTFILE
jgi:hypothetical protein